MTFTNSNGVEGGKTRPFNISGSSSDMSETNVKKSISSAGLLATLFSPLYPRSSGGGDGGNDGTFPTVNTVQSENRLSKTDSSNHLNDAIAETGRQASTASSSSYVYNSTSSPTSPGNNNNFINIDNNANSDAIPPRLRTAQSLNNVEGLLHAPPSSLYNKEASNATNSSTSHNYSERWQNHYANASVPATNSRSQLSNNVHDHLETQMSTALHNLHPVLSNHNIHDGMGVSSSNNGSNNMDTNTVFAPYAEKVGAINSAHNAHPASPCTPHVSSYHQCLDLNPDMKGNCNWAFEKIMKCQENMHTGFGGL